MARGRCPGCGKEDGSSKKIKLHMTSCERYAAAWRANPDISSDPEVEYWRAKNEASSDEAILAKEEATATKYAGYRADAERKLDAARERWGGTSRTFHSSSGSETPVPTPTNGILSGDDQKLWEAIVGG